jgi:hypothetical protein
LSSACRTLIEIQIFQSPNQTHVSPGVFFHGPPALLGSAGNNAESLSYS